MIGGKYWKSYSPTFWKVYQTLVVKESLPKSEYISLEMANNIGDVARPL